MQGGPSTNIHLVYVCEAIVVIEELRDAQGGIIFDTVGLKPRDSFVQGLLNKASEESKLRVQKQAVADLGSDSI